MATFSYRQIFFWSLFVCSICDDITIDVFGDASKHYLPAAFGDFNADKLTDMFAIENYSNGSYAVTILLSHSTSPYFRFTGLQCKFDINIVSIVPSDFAGDGAMDVLVVSLNNEYYGCYLLWGNLTNLSCLEGLAPMVKLKTQPLLVDYNGDMIADIYGEGADDGKRSFWIFSQYRNTPIRVYAADEMEPEPADKPLPPLRISGGHAFIDLDKDLAADLWVSAIDQFEFWSSSNDFKVLEVIELPKINGKVAPVIGQSTFSDVDLDGSLEVILPICIDSSCVHSFIYVYEFTNMSSEWYDMKVNLKDKNGLVWTFPSDKASYLYTNTITPHVGDLNLDGYPDILMTVFNGGTPKVIPLINSKCTSDCEYPRTFVPEWNTFDEWPNSVVGTFFDFLEDGHMDVILVNSSSDGKTYTVAAYKDATEYDAMFLKVLVSTGVCYNDCPHRALPYGTNQPGPSIIYEMISAEGGIQTACASQMSQTGHFALQLPFTMFGLGRNWNFIDELRIGIPSSRVPKPRTNDSAYTTQSSFIPDTPDSAHIRILTKTFTQIIPNSQLVVIPYPKDNPFTWITKLFITPSKAMLMTAGALIATCIFVAAIIVALHLREKQQDKQERRQQAQRFHFDAM